MNKKLIEDKEIISPRILLGVVFFLALVMLHLLWLNKMSENEVFKKIIEIFTQKITDYQNGQFESMIGTEVTLFIAAVAMLTLVTSFLHMRYLGANYKYWFFKERIYILLPQEMVVIMLLAIAGTGVAEFFCVWYLGWICYGIVWWMFILLNHRGYVMVIKVSRIFVKMKKQLCSKNEENRLEWCLGLYKKITNLYGNAQSVHNSYFYEEIGIILYMQKVYAECGKGVDSAKYRTQSRRLMDILVGMIKTEAKVKYQGEVRICDCKKHDVKRQILLEIIERGNAEFGKIYSAEAGKTVKENMENAINVWSQRGRDS